MKQPLIALSAAIVALVTAAAPAGATVITQTAHISFSGVDAGAVTLLLPGMDPDAGPLTGFSFTMTGMLDASVALGTRWALGTSAIFTNAVQIAPFLPSIELGSAPAQTLSPTTMGERTWIGFSGTLPVDYVITAQAGWLDLTLFFETLLTGPAMLATSETIGFTGDVAEDFTYGVPEPKSLAILGLALLGLALLGAGLRLLRQA